MPFCTRRPNRLLKLNPELPAKLEEVMNKALEKDRDLRYQTASEIKTDLKRLKRDRDSATPRGSAENRGNRGSTRGGACFC